MTSPSRALHLFTTSIIISSATYSQQVDCTVQVNYEAVATTHKELLQDFQSDVSNYINGYSWGTDNLDEKVRCTFNIFVSSATGDNKYAAQVFIGSQRPIFGTQKGSAVVRLFDEAWEFTYVRNRPINHNPYTFNTLASFLDFYVYLVLGYDYDTYERLSGTPLFQKAADIASLARSSGQRGWQQSSGGSYNRAQLIDEILNPKYDPVRSAMYEYHFSGLDSLSVNPSRAYKTILHAVETIGRISKQSDPRNQIIKVLFDTKYMEIADLFAAYPDQSVYIKLSAIDPAHQKTYEDYRTRKNKQP
jgi:hypothetical protein